MFVQNTWYVAAFAKELAERRLLPRTILGRSILLWLTDDGALAAFEDRCPHRLLPLSAGRHEGDRIQCGYHGLQFGPDGRCVHIPGQAQIPSAAHVPTFPVARKGGLVWIWMGNAALADSDLIPTLPWAEAAEDWKAVHGYTHVAADYRLLTDNLLDLSHESYVHESTIGNVQEQPIADYPVSVSVEEGQVVRAHREMTAIKPPPFFALALRSDAPIDRWQTAIWAAPALNITNAGVVSAGRPKSEALVNLILHLITPETSTSSHYFWMACRSYRRDETALDAVIQDALIRTFDEDKGVLELQQAQLEGMDDPRFPRFATKLDAAPLRARRMLAALQQRQAADPAFVPQTANYRSLFSTNG